MTANSTSFQKGNRANPHGGFQKGVSGNPGGKASVKLDLARATKLLTPAQREILGLKDGEPLTPEALRALWWKTIIPVAVAGPTATTEASWKYAHQEMGNRLMGKPHESMDLGVGINPDQLAILEALKLTPLQRKARLAELAEGGDDLDAPEPDEPG